MKKKKLKLGQIKVASFVTSPHLIKGGAINTTSTDVFMTRDPECSDIGSIAFCTEDNDCAMTHTFMDPVGGCKMTDLQPCPLEPKKF